MVTVGPGTRLTGADTYVLGSQRFEGGEGVIYDVLGRPDLFAKVFTRPFDSRLRLKVTALIRARTMVADIAAVPLDIVKSNGNDCGIVIPAVRDARPLHAYISPHDRKMHSPEGSLRLPFEVAADLARVVAKLHAAGVVIGDLSPSNVLVRRSGKVCLIDCDSFQVSDIPCEVANEEMLAPELHGANFKTTVRRPEHDAFTLAVLIFQLVCLGRHPFAGNGDLPIQDAIAKRMHALSRAPAAVGFGITGLHPADLMSPAMARMFRRAFGRQWISTRPTAADWHRALQKAIRRLRACAANRTHAYDRGLGDCPWCELDAEGRPAFFAPTPRKPPIPKVPYWQQGAVARRAARLPTISLPAFRRPTAKQVFIGLAALWVAGAVLGGPKTSSSSPIPERELKAEPEKSTRPKKRSGTEAKRREPKQKIKSNGWDTKVQPAPAKPRLVPFDRCPHPADCQPVRGQPPARQKIWPEVSFWPWIR